ncbi:MAG TPA: FecR domain-containing protein [Sphingobacterium sp.]|nr:FecR domain-containing protein [Sphingobacterium sp.]
MHNIEEASRLLKDYLNGKISPDSNKALRNLLATYPHLLEHIKILGNEEGLKKTLATYKTLYNEELPENEDPTLNYILTEIRAKDKRQPWIRVNFKTMTIAASIAALFFITFYVFYERYTDKELTPHQIAMTLTPGTNRAILETSDGRQIELSSDYEGIIVGEDIAYNDGSILLEEDDIRKNVILTLSTPRGGQYQVSLPDGTKVWLNADSKLYYPTVFSGHSRAVELTGEAYFEVARDEDRPFIVRTHNEKIEVLGTHFNINAYDDDTSSSVTLIEGKVKVVLADQQSKILLPGEQSFVKGGVIEVQKIDVAESVAWKNGEFMFNSESLSSVMRKLARWYDIEVDIAPDLQHVSIWGSISRYDNFDEVLQIIKMTDDRIQFKIEGRRVELMR